MAGIGPGSIVAAATPNPLLQVLSAAAQYPKQVEQKKMTDMQNQSDQNMLLSQQQELVNQKQQSALAQQAYQANAQQMATQQATMIGQYALKNPAFAHQPPPNVIQALQQAQQATGMQYLTQNADGSYSINADVWKKPLDDAAIAQLEAMPKNQRAQAIQNYTGDPAMIKQVMDSPQILPPELQMTLAKAQAYINAQGALKDDREASANKTKTELPYEIAKTKADTQAALFRMQTDAMRANAAAMRANAAVQRLELSRSQNKVDAPLFHQTLQDNLKAQSLNAAATQTMLLAAKTYGIPTKNNPQFMDQLYKAAQGDSSSAGQNVLKAISTYNETHEMIEKTGTALQSYSSYMKTNPGSTQLIQAITGKPATVQNVGKPAAKPAAEDDGKIVGHVYKDANGNQAVYLGKGKWKTLGDEAPLSYAI